MEGKITDSHWLRSFIFAAWELADIFHLFTGIEGLLFIISAQQYSLMWTQCMPSHGGTPVFGVRVTFGLRGDQMSGWLKCRIPTRAVDLWKAVFHYIGLPVVSVGHLTQLQLRISLCSTCGVIIASSLPWSLTSWYLRCLMHTIASKPSSHSLHLFPSHSLSSLPFHLSLLPTLRTRSL